jgi:acyl-CoA thioester hydrolase
MFTRKLFAGWADMDFNAHMKNTAFLDKSVDVRMMYFAGNGFPMQEFARRRFGPVVMRDEVEYFREVTLLQAIDVSFALAGLSADGSRMMLRNEFRREDGKTCVKVTSTGGWMDLDARKLMAPPEGLLVALRNLDRTEDFRELPSSIRDGA